MQAGIKARQQAAHLAMRIINQQVDVFMQWLALQSATHIIRSFRQESERLRDSELDSALHALENLHDPKTVLKELAYRLTNKLIHQPTVQLRETHVESADDKIIANASRIHDEMAV